MSISRKRFVEIEIKRLESDIAKAETKAREKLLNENEATRLEWDIQHLRKALTVAKDIYRDEFDPAIKARDEMFQGHAREREEERRDDF
jgi:hypothetical protein